MVDENVESSGSLRKEQAPLLEPLDPKDGKLQIIPAHRTSYINELKLSDFKQVLVRSGISSEFIGGVLWCCNGNVALRRVISNLKDFFPPFFLEIHFFLL